LGVGSTGKPLSAGGRNENENEDEREERGRREGQRENRWTQGWGRRVVQFLDSNYLAVL